MGSLGSLLLTAAWLLALAGAIPLYVVLRRRALRAERAVLV